VFPAKEKDEMSWKVKGEKESKVKELGTVGVLKLHKKKESK
jgi:hypothetical protein